MDFWLSTAPPPGSAAQPQVDTAVSEGSFLTAASQLWWRCFVTLQEGRAGGFICPLCCREAVKLCPQFRHCCGRFQAHHSAGQWK